MPIETILIGTGGFGREVLDVVEARNAVTSNTSATDAHILVRGAIDDAPSQANLNRLADRRYVHLDGMDDLVDESHPGHYLWGIGSPSLKRRVAERLQNSDWRPLTVVHPQEVIGSAGEVKSSSIACGGVQRLTGTRLGRHVHWNPSETIGYDAFERDYVFVNPRAVIPAR